MKDFAILISFLAALALPVGAGEWKSEEDKGIFLHTIRGGTARLELVCDPEGVWVPAEFHVVVTPKPGEFLQKLLNMLLITLQPGEPGVFSRANMGR